MSDSVRGKLERAQKLLMEHLPDSLEERGLRLAVSVEIEAGLAGLSEMERDHKDFRLCDKCGEIIGILWHVPVGIWAKISPERHTPGTDDGGALCVHCASQRSEKLGITLIFHGAILGSKEKDGEEADPRDTNFEENNDKYDPDC